LQACVTEASLSTTTLRISTIAYGSPAAARSPARV